MRFTAGQRSAMTRSHSALDAGLSWNGTYKLMAIDFCR